MRKSTVTPEMSGRVIELGTDQERLVRLPSNPAPGPRWTYVVEPTAVLKLHGSPSVEGGNPQGDDHDAVFPWPADAGGVEVVKHRPKRRDLGFG